MVHNDSSHIQINEVLGDSSQEFIPKSPKSQRDTKSLGDGFGFWVSHISTTYHPEESAVEPVEPVEPVEASEAEVPGANGEAPEVEMVPAEGGQVKEAENVMETPLETPMETESQQDAEAVPAVPAVASQAEEPKDVEMEVAEVVAPAAQAPEVEQIPETGRKDVVEVVDDDEAAEAEAKDGRHKRKAEPEDPPQATPDPPPSEHKQLGKKIRARGWSGEALTGDTIYIYTIYI